MLAKTVRKNLKDINNLKMRTKATKFSNLFSTEPTESRQFEQEIEQNTKHANMVEIEVEDDDSVFEEISHTSPVTLEEITDYIVENPQEVIVKFPLEPIVELTEKLPFFKSVSYKLANI